MERLRDADDRTASDSEKERTERLLFGRAVATPP
jgi:hypothetical protein